MEWLKGYQYIKYFDIQHNRAFFSINFEQ